MTAPTKPCPVGNGVLPSVTHVSEHTVAVMVPLLRTSASPPLWFNPAMNVVGPFAVWRVMNSTVWSGFTSRITSGEPGSSVSRNISPIFAKGFVFSSDGGLEEIEPSSIG